VRTQCQNNLKNLMLAFHTYQSVGSSAASSSRPFPTGCIGPGAIPEERLSWMVALLPYVEQDYLYRKFDLEKGYEGNLSASQVSFTIFHCPLPEGDTLRDPVTSYVAMSGIGLNSATRPEGAPGNGYMGYDRLTSPAMIKDGMSNTIALMETNAGLGPWARGGPSTVRGLDPADVPVCGMQRPFGGRHTGIANAAMADGAVRPINISIDPQKLAGAITIDGGEPFNLDWD
jgi:hypothetical protein